MTAAHRKPPKTLVVGLGKTGLSCARYLAAHGVPVAVTDSRVAPPCLESLRRELPDTALFLGGFDEQAFASAERLLVSPGVSLEEPLIQQARARGAEVIGDIELFCQVAEAPIVAITGSNGKSTVTTLLGEMSRAAGVPAGIGGNLGDPALELLDPSLSLYILELSSFQLEALSSLRPRVAAVLNLSPDHLDRYHDFEHYAETKRAVYRHAQVRLYNRDDPRVMAMRDGSGDECFFSTGEPHQADEFGLRRLAGEGWCVVINDFCRSRNCACWVAITRPMHWRLWPSGTAWAGRWRGCWEYSGAIAGCRTVPSSSPSRPA